MIKVRNLVAKYGDLLVLDDVSLEVNPQEVMVIMGQSGCGKSTFLRHLIGLQRPVSGTVEIDGRDITQMSEDGVPPLLPERRRAVPERRALQQHDRGPERLPFRCRSTPASRSPSSTSSWSSS